MTTEAQRSRAEQVRADRQVWRDLVADVGRDRMLEPGPMGEWTFKDMAAHLAAWRNARIPMVEAAGKGEPLPPPPWPAELGEDDYELINDWFQARDRDRPLEDVLADYDGTFERLAAAIEALPESVAHDPNGLPWAEGTPAVDIDWTEHLHDEHLPDARAWLERSR
jgi:aminoglycoside/choline kinase family phosphotransferase